MKRGRRFAFALALGLTLVSLASAGAAFVPAHAQASVAKPQGWQFDATPYLWGAGLDGDVKIGQLPSGGVEASFSDILSSLEFALMGSFEGRRDRWGFLVDGMYIDLSQTEPTPDAAFGEAEAKLSEQIYSAAGTYRPVEGKVAVDVMAGVRYVDISTDLELTTGVAQGRTASAGRSWWDGFVGSRMRYRPTDKWLVTGYLDVGGGGSELTWQALAGAGYLFNDLVSMKFGYRYLSIDYDDDGIVYDVAMAGPYVGVGFHF